MRLRHLIPTAIAVGLVAAACSGGDSQGENSEGGSDEVVQCAYVAEDEVADVTGLAVVEQPEASSDEVCSFLVDEGPVGVTVQVLEAPTPVEFLALVPQDTETTDVAIEGADQAMVWSESDTVQSGLVRKGGSVARITLVLDAPGDFSALTTLLGSALANLPDVGYTEVDAPGTGTCALIPLEQLQEALTLPDLVAQPAGQATACAFSDPSGVNLVLEVPEGSAGQEQLTLDGRESTVEGETFEWVVEAIPGLGQGALWTEDPVSERSGELIALFGDQLVRVTSSANEPGEAIKDRAVATARVVGTATGG